MKRLTAPFGVTIRMKKVAYCNNNVIPLLKELGIKWDMDTDRIIFCGRRFPMSTIDNGEAEDFINSLITDGQSRLTMWRR